MQTRQLKRPIAVAVILAMLAFLWVLRPGREPLAYAETEREKFHAEVAHALLEMHEALNTIAEYHAKGTMPPNKDELHEKAAHGFKHALELFGVQTKMHK